MWKNLYLFFCFLESANNVREPNNKSSQRQKARVLIEIENNNHFATRKTYTNQKCFFPPFLSHIFLSLSGPRV
jgi:hypothetical protein